MPGRFERKHELVFQRSSGRRTPSNANGRSVLARPFLAVGVLLVAAAMAFAVVTLLRGNDGNGNDGEQARPVTAAVASTVPTTEAETPKGPEGDLRAKPALRIHPQRAAAGLPLQLSVDGVGCPGTSGSLSITEIGTASEVNGADRLVVRRSFDVLADQSFHAEPLLVGQPPGTYRVSIECDRHRTVLISDPGLTRDVFGVTELLELTGPLSAREFDVSPTLATPGEALRVALSGRGCSGPQARVEVRVFAPSTIVSGTAGGPAALVPTQSSIAGWTASHVIGADAAAGTYTFEATCFAGSDVQFDYVARHVRFGTLDEPQFTLFGGSGGTAATAAGTPPSASNQAVPAKPTYTG